MDLDAKTIMWVIENLTNDARGYHSGPRSQNMTFRKGGEDFDFKYFFAGDIREWLANELHQTYGNFLPEKLPKNHDVTDIKERVVICTCGWSAKFAIDHEAGNYIEDEKILVDLAGIHRRRAVAEIMEEFQWDE